MGWVRLRWLVPSVILGVATLAGCHRAPPVESKEALAAPGWISLSGPHDQFLRSQPFPAPLPGKRDVLNAALAQEKKERAEAISARETSRSSSTALELAQAYFPELAHAAFQPGTKDEGRALGVAFQSASELTLDTRGLSFEVKRLTASGSDLPLHVEGTARVADPGHLWIPAARLYDTKDGWRAARVDETWILDEAKGVHRTEYQVSLPPSVRRVHDAGDYLELLDAAGRPVLRFHPSEVRDAAWHARRGGIQLAEVTRTATKDLYAVHGDHLRIATEVPLSGLTPPLVVDPGWSSTASMAVPRAQHGMALLPTGKVLVVGGVNNTGHLASAELFDPATGTWSAAPNAPCSGNTTSAVLLATGKVLAFSDFGQTGLYDPIANSWSSTGPMTAARSLPTLNLLANGKVLIAGGSKLVTAELYDPATSSFSATGSMTNGRSGAASALLPDGRVLVVGGFSPGNAELAAAELYDPATGSWTPAASMQVGRHYLDATLLRNGQVVATGGFTGSGDSNDAEQYNPATNTWTQLAPMTSTRSGHSQVVLPDGELLVLGGQVTWPSPDSSTSELHAPGTTTWTTTPTTMATPREEAASVVLPSGKVLVAGGYYTDSSLGIHFLTGAELYDPAKTQTTATGAMTIPTGTTNGILLSNGKVLVVGGTNTATASLFNPATGTWSAAAPPSVARAGGVATLLQDGRVLLMAGRDATTFEALSSAELYDPATNTWTPTGSLAQARIYFTATLLPDGRVLVVGGDSAGSGPSNPIASVELYDPATGTWTQASPLLAPRRLHSTVLLANGDVLVMGGSKTGSAFLATCERYSPATNTWTAAASLHDARVESAATLLPDGRVLVQGGSGFAGQGTSLAMTSAELYDPVANAWTYTGSLAVARYVPAATLLPSGLVLVAGGVSSSNASLSAVELYDPALGTWTRTADMLRARMAPVTVPMPNGKALIVGGDSIAELYDVGNASAAWRPTVSTPSVLYTACANTVTGARFRGLTEGGDGTLLSSPTDLPLVHLQANEGHRLWTLPGTDMTATSVTVTPPATVPPGDYTLSVMPNAITGGRVVKIRSDTTPVTSDSSITVEAGVATPVTPSASDPDAAQTVTYTLLTQPAHGTLSGTAPNLTYQSTLPYTGQDGFTFQVTDSCGQTSAVATVTLTVQDTTPPSITCPADMTVEATSPPGAAVTYTPALATDTVTASPTITYSPVSGSTLPLGATTVTATATDGAGNQSSCTFHVTVQDTTPPSATCPADMTVEATSASGAPVTYTPAHATDAVTSAPTLTDSPVDGSTLPLGTTAVTVTATDGAGNAGTCTFQVTVQDTTPPTMTCPADVVADATGPDGANVSFPAPTGQDSVSATTVQLSNASGSLFPLGTTVVTATGSDAVGNHASCSFQVTVRDATAPSLTCPAPVHAFADASGGATVDFTLPAADPGGSVTASPASGSRFAEGTTPVVVTAKDANGNTAQCTFDVTVDPVTVSRVKGGGGCAAAGDPAGALGLLFAGAFWLSRRRRAVRL